MFRLLAFILKSGDNSIMVGLKLKIVVLVFSSFAVPLSECYNTGRWYIHMMEDLDKQYILKTMATDYCKVASNLYGKAKAKEVASLYEWDDNIWCGTDTRSGGYCDIPCHLMVASEDNNACLYWTANGPYSKQVYDKYCDPDESLPLPAPSTQ